MIGILPNWLNPEKHLLPDQLIGFQQGAHEFIKGMLSYLPDGSLSLFVEASEVDRRKTELRRFAGNLHPNCGTHTVLPISSIPHELERGSLSAFHTVSGPQLRRLSYLRSLSERKFPITSLIHGFSYHFAQSEIFENLLLTPLQPYDTVICTSVVAENAFRKRMGRVAAQLGWATAEERASSLRTDVIPLGVDVDTFRPRDQADARRLLGLPLDKTLLLHFGRIDPTSKGDPIPLLLAFHEIVKKHGDSVHLVLAGSTSESVLSHVNSVAASLGLSTQMHVRVQPTLIEGPLYYSAADVFISLVETMQESFGITPLEAMASGIPVIVSDWSGYRETVQHGKTGFHVPTIWANCNQDVDLLAPLIPWDRHHLTISQSISLDNARLYEYLDALVSRPDLRAEMGAAGRKRAVETYDWKVVIGQVAALWEELSAVAANNSVQYVNNKHIDCIKSYDDFGHFASINLCGNEVLSVTSRGQGVNKRKAQLLIGPGMENTLNKRLLQLMLTYVGFMSKCRQRINVGQLCSTLSVRTKSPSHEVLKHVMWLVKNDYMRLAYAA